MYVTRVKGVAVKGYVRIPMLRDHNGFLSANQVQIQ